MNYTNRRLSFQVRHRDTADKVILGVAFVLGITTNIVLKEIGAPPWLPAVISACVITIYTVIAIVLPRTRLDYDQVGDNAYYLGFVLTLTALAWTLFTQVQHWGEDDYIRNVVSGFGIALSSTIVGVVARVMCLQFRPDLVARDREARIAINQAMRQFRSEVKTVIRSTKYLGVEIRQSLNEHHDQLRRDEEMRSQTIHSDIAAAIVEALKPTSQKVEGMASEIVSETEAAMISARQARERSQAELRDSVRTMVNDLTQGITQISDATQTSLRSFSQQISNLTNTMEDEVRKALETVASGSTGLRGAVTKAHEKMVGEAAGAVSLALTDLVEELKQVTSGMNPANDALKAATGALENNANRINRITLKYDKQEASFTKETHKIVETLSRALETQRGQHQEMMRALQTSETDLARQVSSLTDALAKFQKEVGKGHVVAEAVTRALSDQAKQHQALLRALKDIEKGR